MLNPELLDQIDKITGFTSCSAILAAKNGVIAQVKQNRINNKIPFKDQYIASSGYVKIQELLLPNDNLNH